MECPAMNAGMKQSHSLPFDWGGYVDCVKSDSTNIVHDRIHDKSVWYEMLTSRNTVPIAIDGRIPRCDFGRIIVKVRITDWCEGSRLPRGDTRQSWQCWQS